MADDINIRKQINELEVGDSANFSIERYDYVLSCRTRIQQRSIVKRFSSSTEIAGYVTITRLLDTDAEVTA